MKRITFKLKKDFWCAPDLSVLDATVRIVKTSLEKVVLGMIHFSTY